MNVFDIDVAPGVMWDSLNEFNVEQTCGWTVDKIEGKGFSISKKAESEEDADLKVNIKFYGTPPADEETQSRCMVRFNRKSGAAMDWAK